MLAVAHRAGNDLEVLREAAELGADVIEADVHLHRGRLEIRHTKSFGTPWLYDAGRFQPSGLPRLHLSELLDALPPNVTVMLDLKGVGRAGVEVARVLHARSPTHPIWVCARWWPSVLPFHDAPWARVLLSARNRAEVTRLRRRLQSGRAEVPHGCSLHLTMLSRSLVDELQDHGLQVLTWPVDDDVALTRARALGVDGVITKELAVLRQVVSHC